jgi:hypothetical protein
MSNIKRSAWTLLSLSAVSLFGLIWRSPSFDLSPRPTVLYHEARGDRSGATIHHMLLAHAYAFQNKYIYGGACFTDPGSGFYVPDHETLIESLGLRSILKFACPTDKEKIVWVDEPTYYSIGSRLFTTEWLEYIRKVQSLVVYTANSTSPSRLQMVVYMRRGDIDLCSPFWSYRYLPNSYYQQLIQEFVDDDMEVSVYSESQSTEAWKKDDEFGSLVDHWHLDAPLVDTWKAIMTADVMILSCSSFSFVPAMFNWNGRIIYTPFWEQPLPHWHVVDNDTMQRMEKTRAQLATELCPSPT